jgi:LmbE family N-acetylglucosaminyl deacetylase
MRFSQSKCALVIGAHPDDAVLGVGGTAAILKQKGWRVIVLTATRGGRGGVETVREEEEQASISILSLDYHQGSMQDGALELQGCLEFLNKWVALYRPATIFTHAPQDTHQDHIVLTQAATIAGRQCPSLLYYEGPSTRQFEPILQIDISSVWSLKMAAIREYRSQLGRLDLIRWSEATANFRSWPHASLTPHVSSTKFEAFQPHRITVDLADFHSNLHLVSDRVETASGE